ncbi:MAG: hypothetical protein L3K26_17855 [Candidatus Hydrogenedentes bacterium]|nr:hypothetical protein [Candidatus Hydrogenedentota bacterium]
MANSSFTDNALTGLPVAPDGVFCARGYTDGLQPSINPISPGSGSLVLSPVPGNFFVIRGMPFRSLSG